jgi:hypothetical protein
MKYPPHRLLSSVALSDYKFVYIEETIKVFGAFYTEFNKFHTDTNL